MFDKRWTFAGVITLLLLFAFPTLTHAHVTVHPGVSSTGAYEKYTVRVPVEKEINTTEVKLYIPEEVNVVSVMPMPEWDYKLDEKDDRIVSITWTETEGGIGEHEFAEFSFVGANPDEAGDVAWKAHQTYEDGSVVRWDGKPDDNEPASITVIEQGESGHNHGHGGEKEKEERQTGGEEDDSSTGGTLLPTILAGLALVLSIIALLRKR